MTCWFPNSHLFVFKQTVEEQPTANPDVFRVNPDAIEVI